MGVKRSHPSITSSEVILKKSTVYLPTSSDIGTVDAPAWKGGGATSGTGNWGGSTTPDAFIISYADATGTAGFVRLHCTGDTAAFDLVQVEGEDLDNQQSFDALTNDSDYLYIAFKGTLSSGSRGVEVAIQPKYVDGSAKSMTITAYSHTGSNLGTLTATATITELLFTPTSISDFADIYAYDGSSGTAHMAFGTVSGKTGLYQTLAWNGWSGGNGGYARIDKEITSGSSGYLEFTNSDTGGFQMAGLCYKSDFTAAGLDNLLNANDTRNCQRWAFYNHGGTSLAAGDWVNSPDAVFSHSSGGNLGSAPLVAADRSVRISWSSNTVKLQYSDDDWSSSTDVHTFASQIDIATNGNLYACFSTYSQNLMFENIKLFGSLS